jgi:hypothetical protein
MARDLQCERCTELWREYAAATFGHIRIAGDLQIATLGHDEEVVRSLAPKVGDAMALRVAARKAIRLHESEAHPPADFKP